ncbi:MAG: DUF4878 domain-containing protein [Chitinophagaceae bacterium]|nr:DUF4878 domain-containing protein [Bacteroidota bacterium]MCC6256762.1 DUF4878 domain-containing protein [Chitinophagaceae bacterium]MCW5915799.1 DUF4878 domain-containing protein [Ferruginibacter sp.]
MKILTILGACLFFLACNNPKKERPADALETGRVFIRASLDGDFKTAENLLYKDSLNVQFFDTYKTLFSRLGPDKKKRYKESNYNINKYEDINDSTTIINYSNSYMNRPMEIKVIKKDGAWWVDFKYVSSGNLPID